DRSNNMGFGLFSLLEAGLLLLNAICVLHRERFLARFGWSSLSRETSASPA
ncbi:hypothetical protein BOX15_Mlig033217g1, partial [Macrostomum lignano]